MMKVQIPMSLFEDLTSRLLSFEDSKMGNRILTFHGTYGEYEIVGVPDENYTEKKTDEVLRYKETT